MNNDMDKASLIGRILFGISIVAFGIEQFIFSNFISGLILPPAWLSGHIFIVYLVAAFFVVTGISIVGGLKSQVAAYVLTIFWFLCMVSMQMPALIAKPANGGFWTTVFEVLAICGSALLVAGMSPGEQSQRSKKAIMLGRIFYGISLSVFGVLHFVFVVYVAYVQPGWIPRHVFWAYFTGVAHIAAGLSIVTKVLARLASILLAIMFGLWVLILHLPRSLHDLHNQGEWNSGIIALAMCAGALLVYGSLRNPQLAK